MAGWTGSGTFTRIYSWVADAAAGIDITASRMDDDTDNVTTNGFNNCLTRDGQGSATANLPLNNFRFTNAGNGVNPQDFVTMAQLTAPAALNIFATGLTVNSVKAIGATFTATGSGTNLVVSNVTGTIVPGSSASATIIGPGVPANTFLVSQSVGSPGGAGTYVTNQATTPSAQALAIQLGGVVVQNGGLNVAGGIVSTSSLTAVGSLIVPQGSNAQFGQLNNLNAASALFSVENTTGPAVQFMNSNNVANDVVLILRNDRTDGIAVAFQFGAASTVGSITQNGSTTSFNTSSDARLKIDDGLIDGAEAVTILGKLKPRWYRWVREPDRESEPGFFAQQLYRAFPWAVAPGRGKPGSKKFRPWQTDNSKLMPVVVAALQAALAENRKLEKRLSALEARV